jgi:hypothetical protein
MPWCWISLHPSKGHRTVNVEKLQPWTERSFLARLELVPLVTSSCKSMASKRLLWKRSYGGQDAGPQQDAGDGRIWFLGKVMDPKITVGNLNRV